MLSHALRRIQGLAISEMYRLQKMAALLGKHKRKAFNSTLSLVSPGLKCVNFMIESMESDLLDSSNYCVYDYLCTKWKSNRKDIKPTMTVVMMLKLNGYDSDSRWWWMTTTTWQIDNNKNNKSDSTKMTLNKTFGKMGVISKPHH